MSDNVLNPVDLEKHIQEIARRIHEGVKVVTAAEREAREKRRLADLAFARAYMQHDGPAHEKKYAAEVATTDSRAAAEDAEIVFRHAERTARALENDSAPHSRSARRSAPCTRGKGGSGHDPAS